VCIQELRGIIAHGVMCVFIEGYASNMYAFGDNAYASLCMSVYVRVCAYAPVCAVRVCLFVCVCIGRVNTNYDVSLLS